MVGNLVALSPTARQLHEAANALLPTTRAKERPWEGPRTLSRPPWGGCCCPQVVAAAVEEEWEEEEGGGAGGGEGGQKRKRGGPVMQGGRAEGGDGNANADAYGVARGRGGGEWDAILDAAVAYMARMERLYTVDLAVAVDDCNDGGGGWGGKAGAPGGDGVARVNGQAVAAAAAVEEEEDEGAVDHDGNHAAAGNLGPIAHSDRKDGNGSPTPRSGRMTTTTAAGGGAAAIVPEGPLRGSHCRRSSSSCRCMRRVCGREMAITTTTAMTTTATATIVNASPPGAPPCRRCRHDCPYEISSGRRLVGCRSYLASASRCQRGELLSSSRSCISRRSQATRSKACQA
jgi:hypothetical protein